MASTEDLTLKLLNRAEAACAQLEAHLLESPTHLYNGRAKAARCIVQGLARDYRLHQATIKSGRKLKYAARSGRIQHYHERH